MQKNSVTDEKAPLSYSAVAVTQAVIDCHKTTEWSHLVEPLTAVISDHFVKSATPELPFNYNSLLLTALNGGCLAYPQHIALRKLFIETQVRAAIKNGVKQVFIIGGGFDSLALRLHKEFSDVHFIEVDRGKTRDIKIKALKMLGAVLPDFKELGSNLHYLECDLSQANWTQVLQSKNYFSNKLDSVIIAEGVTPYLTVASADNLFSKLRDEIMSDNSQFLVGFAGPSTGVAAIVTDALLKESSETYKFHIVPNQVPLYCDKTGFKINARALSIDLQTLAGNDDVITHKDHPEKFAPEHYYVLTKALDWTPNHVPTKNPMDVRDIPVATITIPAAKPSEKYVIS